MCGQRLDGVPQALHLEWRRQWTGEGSQVPAVHCKSLMPRRGTGGPHGAHCSRPCKRKTSVRFLRPVRERRQGPRLGRVHGSAPSWMPTWSWHWRPCGPGVLSQDHPNYPIFEKPVGLFTPHWLLCPSTLN
jgi:hypothetical protein